MGVVPLPQILVLILMSLLSCPSQNTHGWPLASACDDNIMQQHFDTCMHCKCMQTLLCNTVIITIIYRNGTTILNATKQLCINE